jgi:Holliday junction resolvase
MRGGRAAKQKGSREERHLAALLQEAGFAAKRVPLSGATGGRYSGDISIPLLGIDRTVEVKVR